MPTSMFSDPPSLLVAIRGGALVLAAAWAMLAACGPAWAADLPEGLLLRIEERQHDLERVVLIGVSGPGAASLAAKLERRFEHRPILVLAVPGSSDPVQALLEGMSSQSVVCGMLVQLREDGTATMQTKGACDPGSPELPGEPVPDGSWPVPSPLPPPSPKPTLTPRRLVFSVLQLNMGGGTGLSLGPRPTVDMKLADHWSAGGGLAVTGVWPPSLDSDLVASWHPWAFEHRGFIEVATGFAALVVPPNLGVDLRASLAPGWRWNLAPWKQSTIAPLVDLRAVVQLTSSSLDWWNGTLPSTGIGLRLSFGLWL